MENDCFSFFPSLLKGAKLLFVNCKLSVDKSLLLQVRGII
jgi:hypothetical protein